MSDSGLNTVSAFGFYKKPKTKTLAEKMDARNKQIKKKFNGLCNKKKKPRKLSLKKKLEQSNGVEDWSVRRMDINDLANGSSSSKTASNDEDSRIAGKKLFQWVLQPNDVDTVMSKYWEKKPFNVERSNPSYYSKLLSMREIIQAFQEQRIEYTTNVDVTLYQNDKRETLNPSGRAISSDIWNFYNDGCSIRFLNPHLFFPEVCKLTTTLQEYFHCMVGANVYLTPPNSQGFAPHYDDIEAFVLQIEGKKRWRVYAPLSNEEKLPRESSRNFTENEVGSPILDMVLEPGDLLYFPRGFIHQANTIEGRHSLHLTLSMYQKNSWADLLEILLPNALKSAIAENVELRQGIPLNLNQTFGTSYYNLGETPTRSQMITKIQNLCEKVLEQLPIDDAVDQLAKKFQHDALPPILGDAEEMKSAQKQKFNSKKGRILTETPDFSVLTKFRLLRANIVRLLHEEDEFRLYYHLDNSKYYHEYEPVFLEIDPEMTEAVIALINSYPEYISPKKAGLDDPKECLNVFTELWNRGLLVVKNVSSNQ